jgi:hypothetical protein
VSSPFHSIFRSSSPRALLVVGALACLAGTTACSASTVEETESDEGQLRPGEFEEKVFDAHFVSADRKGSGVDYWRVSLVSDAKGKKYWVATGYLAGAAGREPTATLELVVDDRNALTVRSASSDVPLTIELDRTQAIATDAARG